MANTENPEQQEKDPTQLRDERVKPVVRRVFQVLALHSEELMFGSHEITEDGMNDYYSQFVSDKILPIVFDPQYDLEVGDITYVFALLHQVTNFVKGKVDQTMQAHYDNAVALLFKRGDVHRVTVQDVNKVILSRKESTVDNSGVDNEEQSG